MQKEKEYEVPGPGMYNVKGDFDNFDSSTKNVKNIGMIQKILLNMYCNNDMLDHILFLDVT